MGILQDLPTEQAKAREILDTLQEKDRNTNVCSYPTCDDPRRSGNGIGKSPVFCANPEHNALNNFRARARLKQVAAGETEAAKRQEAPARATIESMRTGVVTSMFQLGNQLEHYVSVMADLADPDLAAARISTAEAQAGVKIAEAEKQALMERELRLKAEGVAQATRRDAQTATEAMEQAYAYIEDLNADLQRLREEAAAREKEWEATLQDLRDEVAEREAALIKEQKKQIEKIQTEAQEQIQQITREARESMAVAEKAKGEALEETRLANKRAHDAEESASIQITIAEQLVKEAHDERDYARKEAQQAQQDLKDLRVTLEDERKEASRLLKEEQAQHRAMLEGERTDHRAILDKERTDYHSAQDRWHKERQRLDEELKVIREQREQAERRGNAYADQVDSLRTRLAELVNVTRSPQSQQTQHPTPVDAAHKKKHHEES